jgi:hypothetical protein
VTPKELLIHAVNGATGRPHVGDPVYREVTEGRQDQEIAARKRWEKADPAKRGPRPVRYSSCGDLPHWLYWQLGVRLPWVNRETNGQWRVGQNLTLLTWPGNRLARKVTGDVKLDDLRELTTGDVLYTIGSYAHVRCVVDYDPATATMTTAEYGMPGGKLKTRKLVERKDGIRVVDPADPGDEGSGLLGWLRLEAVLEASNGAGDPPPPDAPKPILRTLESGDRGPDVKVLQARLGRERRPVQWDPTWEWPLKDDGIFGARTDVALRDFQARSGLTVDGICGRATRAKLGL